MIVLLLSFVDNFGNLVALSFKRRNSKRTNNWIPTLPILLDTNGVKLSPILNYSVEKFTKIVWGLPGPCTAKVQCFRVFYKEFGREGKEDR